MTQKRTPSRDRDDTRANPDLGPTNPVYEEFDQGSQGPPNKPGQYPKDHAPTDTLGRQGGQGPGQGRGANPGEVHERPPRKPAR